MGIWTCLPDARVKALKEFSYKRMKNVSKVNHSKLFLLAAGRYQRHHVDRGAIEQAFPRPLPPGHSKPHFHSWILLARGLPRKLNLWGFPASRCWCHQETRAKRLLTAFSGCRRQWPGAVTWPPANLHKAPRCQVTASYLSSVSSAAQCDFLRSYERGAKEPKQANSTVWELLAWKMRQNSLTP